MEISLCQTQVAFPVTEPSSLPSGAVTETVVSGLTAIPRVLRLLNFKVKAMVRLPKVTDCSDKFIVNVIPYL